MLMLLDHIKTPLEADQGRSEPSGNTDLLKDFMYLDENYRVSDSRRAVALNLAAARLRKLSRRTTHATNIFVRSVSLELIRIRKTSSQNRKKVTAKKILFQYWLGIVGVNTVG